MVDTLLEVIHKAILDKKKKVKFFVLMMSLLLKSAVQFAHPITITGVDFVGLILILSGIHWVTSSKGYISVFV